VNESPAQRVAHVAIDLCAQSTHDAPEDFVDAAKRLADEAGGSRSVLLDAFVLCVVLSTGEAAADRAAHLLDEVQSTNLVT
jgi:hypothetical protein